MNIRQQQQRAAVAQPWNMFADLGRQQMAVATEGAGALLRGIEAIRKIQEQTARQVGARHEAAAGKLKAGCSPNDVLVIQSELLRFDVEAATRYWQELGAAAMETQTELLACAAHLADADSMLEATSAIDHFESAIPGLEDLFTPKPAAGARKRRAA